MFWKVVLKSVLMGCGELCAMMVGTQMTQEWCVDSWGSLEKNWRVYIVPYNSHVIIAKLHVAFL